jgi:hypothetical protein
VFTPIAYVFTMGLEFGGKGISMISKRFDQVLSLPAT